MIDTSLSRIISIIPTPLFNRLHPIKFIVPYYHFVSDQQAEHISNLYEFKNVKQFNKDLEYLLKYFSPISLNDILETVKGNRTTKKKSFHLTFDDGLREIYDVVSPILIRKGIPGTIFVSTKFLDNKSMCYQHKASILAEKINRGVTAGALHAARKYLLQEGEDSEDVSRSIMSIRYNRRHLLDKLDEILEGRTQEYLETRRPYMDSYQVNDLISKGFTFGAHSLDHPLYADLGLEEQLFQTVESIIFMNKNFCLDYVVFAFPHSDNGVTVEFFDRMREKQFVDLYFGTGGMINQYISNRCQRFSLEKPVVSARRIISYYYTREITKNLFKLF